MIARRRHCAAPVSRRREAGFTLIEIILATMLLALGLSIAFASVHTANGSVQRAERAAARNEHLRAVQQFLYRTLQSAQPLVLARDDATQKITYFDGAHDTMRFVAPLPGYLSRGGPYVLTLKLAPSGKGDGTQQLQFAYAMLINEKPLDDDTRLPPEGLLDGVTDARFEYLGVDSDGIETSWHDSWDRSGQLPLEVRIRLRFADATQPWPAFATALPLGFLYAHAPDAAPTAPRAIPAPTQDQPPPSAPKTGGE